MVTLLLTQAKSSFRKLRESSRELIKARKRLHRFRQKQFWSTRAG